MDKEKGKTQFHPIYQEAYAGDETEGYGFREKQTGSL